MSRLLLITLTLIPAAMAADPGEAAQQKYLQSVTQEIRSRMTGVKVLAGVATNVEFTIWHTGGDPQSVYITMPTNSDWDGYVKKTLKECRFEPFTIGDADQLKISAKISYFPNSDKPQPGIVYTEAHAEKSIPLWRMGGVLFYSAIAVCGFVSVIVQGVLILLGLFSLKERFVFFPKFAREQASNKKDE
jgi:hypothetical protein